MRSSWMAISVILSFIVVFPLLVLLQSLMDFQIEVWQYLWETRLWELIWNTLRLAVGVGIGTFLIGTSLAWLTVMYQFPGKSFFEGSLLLPLAIPGYVIGFVFVSQWDFFGVVPQGYREVFGAQAWFPELRSYPGIVMMMTLVLYPYVYLASRTSFREQNIRLIEVARTLGLSHHRAFWKVALPVARPSIVAGVSLALMETIADFGTVGVFSYDTLTTAIYELWYGLSNKQASTQLAGILLMFTLCIFMLEQHSRGNARYYQIHSHRKPPVLRQLFGWKKWIAVLYPTLILGAAFLYPVSVLTIWVLQGITEALTPMYWELLFNTLSLAGLAAVITLSIAIVMSYTKRLFDGKFMFWITRFASMGYALPGSVVAVGVLIPLAWIDHHLNFLTEQWLGKTIGLLFTGSVLGLLFAYTVRFLAVAFNSVDASLSKVTLSMDMAARNLGATRKSVLFKIHFPLIENGLVIGFIIVFVDVMKEMPATLLLRPFGHETLSTRIWQLTAESYWVDAALPALTIVAVELIPVLLLIYLGRTPLFSKIRILR